MRELSAKDIKFIDGKLSRFILDENDRQKAIVLLRNGLTTAEVYRIMTEKRGVGKAHQSGKYKEGKIIGS